MGLKQRCYICGDNMFTQRHHIIQRAKGGMDDPSNIIRLCASCHTGVHHGMYDVEDLFKLKKIRESEGRRYFKPKPRPELPLEMSYSKLTPDQSDALDAHARFSPVEKWL